MPSALLCSLLYTFLLISISQTRGQVNVGTSLTAGDETERPWISPSGDFAFGFHRLEKTDLYLLCIWYNKIPNTTIVWYANGDNPAPKGSKIELTEDRGLVLSGPQGPELWQSGISTGQANYGLMNDTGNFMVKNSEAETLWESFEHPTDTLLPGQTLEKGGNILNARLRETNFSLGRFQFRLIRDGNGVLNFNNLPTGFAYDAYYWTNTVDTDNATNAGLRVVFNESGYLYVLRANGNRVAITPPGAVLSPENFYHRVVLHFDGVLAQYSYLKNSTSSNDKWETVFKQPESICNSKSDIGTGPCGFNSVCRLNEDQRATCQCPTRFSLLDPSDEFGGCKPDFRTHFCDDNEPVSPDLDPEFIQLTNVDWPTSDYEIYSPYTLQDCQKSCRDDCFCNAIVFRDGSCWKKKLPLSNGRRDESLSSTIFIKARRGNDTEKKVIPFPIPFDKKTNDSLVLVVSLILGGSVFINFVFFGLMGFGSLVFYNKKSVVTTRSSASNLQKFTYKDLLKATNGFKDEIGRGSFGIVYKGQLELFIIAVKKLDRVVSDTEREFNTEIEVIGQTHHRNLVKLIGYCNEGQNRLLVYEFVTNGTLSSYLFASKKLNWRQRTQVAKGTARGLVYLHEECNTPIIHCDIKPQNVLLDQNFDAKIADFGLAKLLMLDQSRTFTAVRGTKGYVAPEWFRNLPVTPKVDVYSFGVLLLEIICCRKNVESSFGEDEAILVDWVRDCYFEGKIDVLVGNDGEAMDDLEKVERFLKVAIWCIQEDPNIRPTMKMVLSMLEGISDVENPPLASTFSVATEINGSHV